MVLSRRAAAWSELAGLAGLAFAQPVLADLAASPETLVSRRLAAWELFVFVALLSLGPPTVLFALEEIVGRFSETGKRALHVAATALLGELICVQLLTRAALLSGGAAWLAGAAAGLLLAFAIDRLRPARTFARYLTVGVPIYAASFFTGPGVADTVFTGPAAGSGARVGNPVPIVMVVMDELPLTSLLDESGKVDRELFPSFAELADTSTLYRNHTTVSPTTPEAVPAILTGRFPEALDVVPTYERHPDNLFRLLAGTYRLNVWEQVTRLCPPDTCPTTDSESPRGLSALVSDGLYLIAGRLRGDSDSRPVFQIRQSDPAAPMRFERFVRSLGASREPRLDFLHVLLPHQPWRFLPDGRRYNGPFVAAGLSSEYHWIDPHLAEIARQRHLLQLRYTDRLLGLMLDRLRELGTFDRTMIVVTADHGVSFRNGEPIRGVGEDNQSQVLWTPLFVKLPHQRRGVTDDRQITSVDVLPTVAEVLQLDIPYTHDGMPASRRGVPVPDLRRVYDWEGFSAIQTDPGEIYATIDAGRGFREVLEAEPWPDLVDDPALRLFAFGRWGHLVGARVDELTAGTSSDISSVTLDDPDEHVEGGDLDFADVDLDGGMLPLYVTGSFQSARPNEVVIAVNGRVAGWSPPLPLSGSRRRFAVLTPPQFWREGANRIEVFEVRDDGGPARLMRIR
ncbi:MAG: hypothetical protein KatS3mg008_1864 [Acidimicrobiales bacterium]|nr:MAG: hypothetical protein KatS3mg008_1864 [Acidimicrobiales bacterium]